LDLLRRGTPLPLFLSSLLLVGYGQPSHGVFLSALSGVIGYPLFWLSLHSVLRPRSRFLLGTLWFGAVQLLQISWMTSTQFQGPLTLILCFVLSLLWGLQFGWLTLLAVPGRITVLKLASLWVLLEWSRLYFFCGWSLNFAGFCWVALPWGRELLGLFGPYGLSFWVTATGLLGYLALVKERSWHLFIGVMLLPMLLGSSMAAVQEWRVKDSGSLRMAALAPNLLPSQKIPLPGHLSDWIPPLEQWAIVCQQLRQLEQVDLLLLPEVALFLPLEEEAYSFKEVESMLGEVWGDLSSCYPARRAGAKVSNAFIVQTLANHLGCHLVVGMESVTGDLYQQGAFHFSPKARTEAVEYESYIKRKLLPVAEALPSGLLGSLLRPLAAIYGIQEFYAPGTDAGLFRTPLLAAPLICYEETFPSLVGEAVRQGAQLLLLLSNDSWYPHSQLPQQHFWHAATAALSHGVGFVRSCNGGISGAMDAYGRMSIADGATLWIGELPLALRTTLYTLVGDVLLVGACVILLLSNLFAENWKNRKNRERSLCLP